MDERFIEQVIELTDLRALAEEAGAVFSASNSSRCPLHGGDNPTAFHLYRGPNGRQRWHCFTRCPGDANDGDAIAFYMRWRGVDFPTAVRELAARAGLSMPVSGRVGGAPHHQRPHRSRQSVIINTDDAPPSETWRARAASFVNWAVEQLWDDTDEARAVRVYLHEVRGLRNDTLRQWKIGFNPRTIFDNPKRWGLSDGKRIWLPRGIVIPGVRGGEVWYVKVRRPLPSDALGKVLGAVRRQPEIKFGGPRGGRVVLWGADGLQGLPVCILTEGEWDGLLAWQEAHDFCDVVAQGGAMRRLTLRDAVALAAAVSIVSIYDLDAAGSAGAQRLAALPRVKDIKPPAHDLVDFHRQGGDLRQWLARIVAGEMEQLLGRLDERQHGETFVRWLHLYETASNVAGDE